MQAYTEAFQPSDDVALIVHSSYGDHFWEQELQDSMHNSSQPAVLFFQVGPLHPAISALQSELHPPKVQLTLGEVAFRILCRSFRAVCMQ